MPIDDASLLAALRKPDAMSAVCAAAGASEAEFTAARDAFLARHARPQDRQFAAAVRGRVEIVRDRAGVPHIKAGDSEDLYFGLGVAMAEDRLWQMDRLRRRALGRQAEVLGQAYLASDIAHLTVGIDRVSASEATRIDGNTYRLVAAFVAGINRQIEAFGTVLPVEFTLLNYAPRPFTVQDVVATARGLWWSLNGRIDRLSAAEAARFMPTEALRELYLTPEAPEHLVVPEARGGVGVPGGRGGLHTGTDDATGSNNWAVTGARTGSGHAVLAGDPHQPFWVPGSWYEYAVHGPEDDAAGAGHPGVPGLWWGSNRAIAWSLTNNAASCRDLYREVVDPADPGRYRDGDQWRQFEQRALSIPVRGAASHALVVRETTRGPIVNALVPAVTEGGDPPLSLRWVGHEHLDDLRASIALARARDWKGFRAALADWSVAVFNYVYADRDGNAGYQMSGRVPVRGRVVAGYRDADNPDDRWLGHIPFERLPHEYNPARGYVASANQQIVGPEFTPPIYGAYSQGHRGVRIDQVFAAQPKSGRTETIMLQNDIRSARATRMVPHILNLLQTSTAPDAKLVTGLLGGWSGDYSQDSVAATMFETLMFHWQRAVLALHLPDRLLNLAQQQTGLAMSLLEQPKLAYFPDGTAARLAATCTPAVAALRERLGEAPSGWNWGRVHVAHWKHPASTPSNSAALDIGPAALDGGSHTVRNTGGELPPHNAFSGAEYRIVVDFSAPESFLAVQNIGNSGVPGSPHYADQFGPWQRGEYHEVQLRMDKVEAESRTVITPG
jgi:penicillin amidase